jgi:hypothetical protein
MQYAAQNLIPVTLELGGKSPNVFFNDIASEKDDFYDKTLEGFTMFALNQGEVCTCPSRALIQSGIYDTFVPDAVARTKAIKQGNPLDTDTMIGAQASNDQLEKILSYFDIGQKEGAKVLTGGERVQLPEISAVATTSLQRSSRAPTTCGSSRRRSSARCCGHQVRRLRRRAQDRQRHAVRPGRRRVDRDMNTAYRMGAASRPVASGPTATTPTPPRRRSAATRAPASAGRTTR